MQDRWDRAKFADRSVEDLKSRYYSISSTLKKVGRAGSLPPALPRFIVLIYRFNCYQFSGVFVAVRQA